MAENNPTPANNQPNANANNNQRRMRDLGKPVVPNTNSPINLPDAVRNYELKGVYYNQLPAFHGLPNEDPLIFMRSFYSVVENFSRNGLSNEQLRLRCFPYTLKDRASAWWLAIPAGTLNSWSEIYEKFMAKFYSHTKTMNLRQLICTFAQGDDEPFHEAWDRFKALQISALTITIQGNCLTNYFMMA